MKRKGKTDEYRMKASKFDEIMRRALATPGQEPKPKAAKKTTKKPAPKK